jgi:hypothetical protein
MPIHGPQVEVRRAQRRGITRTPQRYHLWPRVEDKPGGEPLSSALAQTAEPVRDSRLLELAESSHPETLRQMRWANAKLKELSPQVMSRRA